MFPIKNPRGGMLLIDAVVGIGLLTLVFVALFGVLNMSTAVIINTKSRIGALALATEQLEYLRSLSYDSVGTSGGIPAGNVPQNETIQLNGVNYTRHTEISYIDDSADGFGYGGEHPDINTILNDYKKAEVTVSWKLLGRSKNLKLATSIVPKGTELDCVNCGSMLIHIRDMNTLPVSGANVTLTSSTIVPAINLTRVSEPSGDVNFIGVPVGPEGNTYHVVVSRDGYSTDQTYTATGVNTNPNPADFSVFDNQTQEATFRIDYLGSKTIDIFKTPIEVSWTDSFNDISKISAFDFAIVNEGDGIIELEKTEGIYASDGSAFSEFIDPAHLSQWIEFLWIDSGASATTSVVYKIYYDNDGVDTLIPNSVLPGNSIGFSVSPVDLSSLNIETYPKIKIAAFLHTSDTTETPRVYNWAVRSMKHEPFSSFAFNVRGDKTIGKNSDGVVLYKYDNDVITDGLGKITLSPMEWDTYTITASGYDITESCPLQPKLLNPGEIETMSVDFSPHSENSLLVSVKNAAGSMVQGATVHLFKTDVDIFQKTSTCGQAFLSDIVASNTYSLEVGAPLYATTTILDVSVSGTSNENVVLLPL